MKVIMDMQSCEVESKEGESVYGDEVMYASWNPVAAGLCSVEPESAARNVAMPADLLSVDVERFLERLRAELI
jgi:hypothetical protein